MTLFDFIFPFFWNFASCFMACVDSFGQWRRKDDMCMYCPIVNVTTHRLRRPTLSFPLLSSLSVWFTIMLLRLALVLPQFYSWWLKVSLYLSLPVLSWRTISVLSTCPSYPLNTSRNSVGGATHCVVCALGFLSSRLCEVLFRRACLIFAFCPSFRFCSAWAVLYVKAPFRSSASPVHVTPFYLPP